MALSYFGEAFASKVLRKFLVTAITPVIANTNYEGEVKEMGDRVSILQFLDDVPLGTYSANTDMTTTFMTDYESQLIVDQQKYWNFSIDRIDQIFTYANDVADALVENAAQVLVKTIDARILKTHIEEVKAGNRVPKKETDGVWSFVVGDAGSFVTITTSATVATATLTGAASGKPEFDYFPVDILKRGFRITSDLANSPWYRITTRTSSTVITFNNWDGSVTGNGGTIYPLFSAESYPASYATDGGYGCQIEGMEATQVTKTNIYALVCDLKTALDDDDVPAEDRHLTVPPWFQNLLIQAADLTPDIAMYHQDVVINGKVGRVAGFDVHMVSDDRFSTDAEPIYPNGAADTGTSGYKILANHISWITFAHKWAESRVVDAENQFAKKYQGLNVYGFKVTNLRRKAGAYLFGYK